MYPVMKEYLVPPMPKIHFPGSFPFSWPRVSTSQVPNGTPFPQVSNIKTKFESPLPKISLLDFVFLKEIHQRRKILTLSFFLSSGFALTIPEWGNHVVSILPFLERSSAPLNVTFSGVFLISSVVGDAFIQSSLTKFYGVTNKTSLKACGFFGGLATGWGTTSLSLSFGIVPIAPPIASVFMGCGAVAYAIYKAYTNTKLAPPLPARNSTNPRGSIQPSQNPVKNARIAQKVTDSPKTVTSILPEVDVRPQNRPRSLSNGANTPQPVVIEVEQSKITEPKKSSYQVHTEKDTQIKILNIENEELKKQKTESERLSRAFEKENSGLRGKIKELELELTKLNYSDEEVPRNKKATVNKKDLPKDDNGIFAEVIFKFKHVNQSDDENNSSDDDQWTDGDKKTTPVIIQSENPTLIETPYEDIVEGQPTTTNLLLLDIRNAAESRKKKKNVVSQKVANTPQKVANTPQEVANTPQEVAS